MNSRRAIQGLLIAALGLPLLQGLLHWIEGLLAAMGDQGAAKVLGHCGTAAGILWLIAITGLVIAVGFKSLEDQE